MRVQDSDRVLARVFLGDASRWHHLPLAPALLERLRAEGFAGATVIHGVAGFGPRSVVPTANLLDLSADLPVVVEIVDAEEQIQRLLPILDEMVPEGMVTLEKVRVVRYGTKPS